MSNYKDKCAGAFVCMFAVFAIVYGFFQIFMSAIVCVIVYFVAVVAFKHNRFLEFVSVLLFMSFVCAVVTTDKMSAQELSARKWHNEDMSVMSKPEIHGILFFCYCMTQIAVLCMAGSTHRK